MTAYQEFLENPTHRIANICRVSYVKLGEGVAELLYWEPTNDKWYRPAYLTGREEAGYAGTLYFNKEVREAKIIKIEIVTTYTPTPSLINR
jgi:hypothetical protein